MEPRHCRPAKAHFLIETTGEMLRGRRADPNEAGFRGHSSGPEVPDRIGCRILPCRLVVDDYGADAAGAAGRASPILSEHQVSCALTGKMLLDVRQSKAAIGNDPIEIRN